ncbi:MAG: methylated-DNA-protein-cysteine methyltransferase-like protein [Oceanospirillaceae bacterium]|jgi:methylated-DNA-protein-cysteine methyltransferase-like protein
MIPSNRERVWQVIHCIPSGKICTYGRVAQMAGLPRQARAVGRYLSELPENSKIPWHRVLNSQGKLSFSVGSERFLTQKLKLQSEDVQFSNNKVDLKYYLWQGE